MRRDEEEGLVRVFRFDPEKEEDPEYKDYRVPYREATVLQILEHLYENDDPSLAFRFGCCGSGPARCGACALEVNDIPALACQKQAEKKMVLKPHRKFRVIKDLVVDFETERDEE